MQPSISIIIPAYNADRTIAQTLEACLAQDYPKDALEIIVVDDGSTDDTKDIVARYPVRYIAQKNAGPAAARNRGWRAAKGELICFTDADCIPEKAWATKIARGYESDNVGAVGGSYDIANPRSLLASCIHQEILARHESMPRSVRALGSYNLSVRRELLERVGGFDEMYRTSSGEDNDLSYRLLREGKQLMFDRSIVVAHHHPENLGRYLRTQFWHGYWRVRLYLGHPSMAQGDDYSGIVDYLQPVVAVAAVGAGALAPLLPIAGKIAAALLVIEVALQVPMIARVVRRAPRARYLFLLFVTFMRAFARGLGMARGVLRAVTKHRTRLFMVACVSGALMLAGGAGARCDDTDASPKKFSASDPGEIRKAIEYLKGQQASNPDDPGTREQLAQAYNYYAIQCSAQDMASAIEYMQRAVDLSPGNAAYRKSLGMLYLKVGYGYYQAKEMQRASDTVKSSLAADPENVEALALMGAIFYADGKTAEALGCWSRGLELAPQNDVLVQNIQRVRKEITAQTTFKKRETQNFVFTFAEGLNEFKFGNMESILNEVYVKIGQAFSYFPTYRVTVEIYPAQQYRSDVAPSENIIGVYDGKIKLPEYSDMTENDYRRIVYHEYMHAIVFDLSGGRAPTWLHEALATNADPGFTADDGYLAYLYQNGKLVAPRDLDPYFLDMGNHDHLMTAYNEANALIRYFLSRYNYWHMKNILTDLKRGMNIDEAFKKEVAVDIGGLFEQWQEAVFKR